jgi:hypothetical protein
MLGGNRTQALRVVYYQGRPYSWSGGNVSEKPDWENAPYVYKGTSNATSFNHNQPKAYRDKSERAGSTGAYKKDPTIARGFLALLQQLGQENLGRPKRGV